MRNHSVIEMLQDYFMPIISILKSCNIPAGWPLGHRDIAKQGLLKEALSEPPSTHLYRSCIVIP